MRHNLAQDRRYIAALIKLSQTAEFDPAMPQTIVAYVQGWFARAMVKLADERLKHG